MSKRGMQWGFTLTEVLVALAAIGVLLALAWPVYADYVSRARLDEAMGLISTVQIESDVACRDGQLDGATNDKLGLGTPGSFASKWVQSVTVSGAGSVATITIAITAFGGMPAGSTLVIKGNCSTGGIAWTVSAASTVPQRLWPKI